MRVLEIGGNIKPQAASLIQDYSEAEIIRLDIDPETNPDIVADAANPPEELFGTFDGVFASHVLEHFSYWHSVTVLKVWRKLLVPGGMVHILVPSLEWAARQILSENPSPAVYPHLFAGQMNQWDLHYTGYTMRKLRYDLHAAGFHVVRARTGRYQIKVADKEYLAEQHYAAGVNPIEGMPPNKE